MAIPAAGNCEAAVETDSAAKKKTRLNPARRKAARAKSEVELGRKTNKGATETTSPSPKPPVRSKTEASVQNVVPKRQPVQPPPLSRQNTEELRNVRRPTLGRSITAPERGNTTNSLTLATPALVTGGLVGCAAGAAIMLGVGIWYDFAGAESAILTARTAKLCVDNLTEELVTSLKTGTYSADEALDMLRRTTLAYASTIPEGAPFVERMFREIGTVRKQRGKEIDMVVAETHAELSKAGKTGATSAEMRAIVVRQLMKLSSFASKATHDVVARNPTLRPYGEEAKKALRGPPESKVPTVRVNMAVRQKQFNKT